MRQQKNALQIKCNWQTILLPNQQTIHPINWQQTWLPNQTMNWQTNKQHTSIDKHTNKPTIQPMNKSANNNWVTTQKQANREKQAHEPTNKPTNKHMTYKQTTYNPTTTWQKQRQIKWQLTLHQTNVNKGPNECTNKQTYKQDDLQTTTAPTNKPTNGFSFYTGPQWLHQLPFHCKNFCLYYLRSFSNGKNISWKHHLSHHNNSTTVHLSTTMWSMMT